VSAREPLELREIAGPTALGGGWRRFFDLLWLTAKTEFRLSYHGTILGFLWSFLRPLLLFAVLLVVFTRVIRFDEGVENYPAMLLFNVMLFTFFSDATGQAVTSVVRNENVVRKMQFPRLVIPLAVVLNAAIQLLLSLVVVFVFLIAYGVEPVWTWIFTPVIVGAMVVLTTATSMLLAALYVRVRDVANVWSLLSMTLFYATPILYPWEATRDLDGFRELIQLNPLTPIFEQAREWIIDPDAGGAIEAAQGNELLVLAPALVFVGICALSIWLFNREAPRIAEAL
jgi:ABC-2 type transport system permease protein